MIGPGVQAIVSRVLAFAAALSVSLAVVNSRPRFKERRQRYFAHAAAAGSLSRMQLLHLAGANINSNAASRRPLFLAAGEGRLRAVRYLLDEGAEVNAPESDGNTPLTEATFYGHAPVVKELLARGADINAVAGGGTALDIAISKNHPAIIDMLRHYGAKRAAEIR
jgi:ankyrin repeat protein